MERTYIIKIYGPVIQKYLNEELRENVATEFMGLSPLRAIPEELYKVKIHALKFPSDFAEQNHDKGFVRVRIVQGLGEDPNI